MACQKYNLQIALLFIFTLLGRNVVELTGSPVPLGKSKIQAHQTSSHVYSSNGQQTLNVNNGGFISNLLRKYLPVIPNTYYDVPKHRYPYYDENGTGRLLYGYGGKKLYKYTVFKPLEGYFKWSTLKHSFILYCDNSSY